MEWERESPAMWWSEDYSEERALCVSLHHHKVGVSGWPLIESRLVLRGSKLGVLGDNPSPRVDKKATGTESMSHRVCPRQTHSMAALDKRFVSFP